MAQAQWRDKVPFGTQLHRCSFTPFCIFRHLLGPLFTLFNTQRFFLLIWGIHTCLTHLFSKKEIITCITTFKKKKREKWTKLRFFKTMDSCPKLGAFDHASFIFPQKKKKKKKTTTTTTTIRRNHHHHLFAKKKNQDFQKIMHSFLN